jgi:hypothetical protein
LEIGVPYGIVQLGFESLGILASDTWIKKVWAELDSIGYHLSYRQAALPLGHTKDSYLISTFSLKWLNWWAGCISSS